MLASRSRYRKNSLKVWLTSFRGRINFGKLFFATVIFGFIAVFGTILWFSRGLPDPSKVVRKSGYSSVVLDRSGEKVLYNLFVDENRKFTEINDIPDYLKKATIAVEDKDFYKHTGFDPLASLRIVKNLIVNGRLIGGSTLTQQLVKMMLLTNERTVTRKIKEFILAVRIEKQFSKDQILQMYLNEAPYGGTADGVAAAAQMYFGKDVKDLNLTECVILAGIPQSPSRYSPYISDGKAYVNRAKEVARRMKEDGYIDSTLEAEVVANLDKVEFKKLSSTMKAGHFVMYVKQKLEEMFGPGILEAGGLKVVTTLDMGLQESAEKIVSEEIDKVKKSLNISNGASVILDTNSGEILSMVGSRNFLDTEIDGQVNVVTRLRQPGSSIKPLVYATAFGKGFSPATPLMDVVTEFPGKDENTPYIPKDYDGKERGPVRLRDALGSSLNVPAVKLLAMIGVKDVLDQGYKMGLSSLESTQENLSRLGLSMALGGGEVRLIDLASAYGAFANGGYRLKPEAILRVEDQNGKILYEKKQVRPEKVLDEKVAFLINSVLSDNNARLMTFGQNSYLNLGARAVAVKTGTTNDLKDNWTIGWSRDIIVGVWVGNNDNKQMKNVASGVSGAAPIWRREMLESLTKYPDKPFDPPSGVSQIEVDKISGYRSHDGFESVKEWFIDGTVPDGDDPYHFKLKVCRNQSDKLASAVQIAGNDFDTREAIVFKEKDPLTNKDLWQRAIDGWVATKSADARMKIPTEYCQGNDDINVRFISPDNKKRINGDNVSVKFDVVSDKDIEWADLYFDGNMEQRFTGSPYQRTFMVTSGQHSIRVRARNKSGKETENILEFSVNEDFGVTPAITATLTPSPTSTSSAH